MYGSIHGGFKTDLIPHASVFGTVANAKYRTCRVARAKLISARERHELLLFKYKIEPFALPSFVRRTLCLVSGVYKNSICERTTIDQEFDRM